ncbi:MAG TPA: cell division protein FtsQ [Cyclobacteriaceae bacterium]|nr:cell division protein FtsQ [Cyclobacteriaceae bacterium]MCB9238897.1 cell division protein FtsQ [Flammeovirgaceae bacterium]MCB0498173.1 cell division protein FtsQ [Cyclobacteriaceae bacterium]MCO5270616.1 cell division protein FtsQ [Cyclobacteriaceae bacterium]MCW5900943.1 cell division protein FtsQ [Cyclobacteriaceae bacterium]
MKLKLNMRTEIKIAIAVVGLFLLIAFGERNQRRVVCKNIVVDMENTNENHFLDEADILGIIEGSGQTIIGKSLEEINLRALEKRLGQDKHISSAEIFGDVKGNLTVNVKLRRPVARLVRMDGPDAYIAGDGKVMETSQKYSARIILVSGDIVDRIVRAGDTETTEEGKALMAMIGYINKDRFWKAQVAQLDFDKTGKVFIYPQVTGQVVEFGMPDNIEEKFRKLMVFYKDVLPQMGWTKYDRVNVEYEGQVIAE